MCIVGHLLRVELSGPSGCWLEDDRVRVWGWGMSVDVMFCWMRVVDNLVVDDLWLGEFEDDHRKSHDE